MYTPPESDKVAFTNLFSLLTKLTIYFQSGKSALGLASRGSFIGIVDMIIKADRRKGEPADIDETDGVSIMRCGRYHHCFYSATCNATWNQNQNQNHVRLGVVFPSSFNIVLLFYILFTIYSTSIYCDIVLMLRLLDIYFILSFIPTLNC